MMARIGWTQISRYPDFFPHLDEIRIPFQLIFILRICQKLRVVKKNSFHHPASPVSVCYSYVGFNVLARVELILKIMNCNLLFFVTP